MRIQKATGPDRWGRDSGLSAERAIHWHLGQMGAQMAKAMDLYLFYIFIHQHGCDGKADDHAGAGADADTGIGFIRQGGCLSFSPLDSRTARK